MQRIAKVPERGRPGGLGFLWVGGRKQGKEKHGGNKHPRSPIRSLQTGSRPNLRLFDKSACAGRRNCPEAPRRVSVNGAKKLASLACCALFADDPVTFLREPHITAASALLSCAGDSRQETPRAAESKRLGGLPRKRQGPVSTAAQLLRQGARRAGASVWATQ